MIIESTDDILYKTFVNYVVIYDGLVIFERDDYSSNAYKPTKESMKRLDKVLLSSQKGWVEYMPEYNKIKISYRIKD